MKAGDLVMFVDKGRYSRWFFGQFAVIESYTEKGSDGKAHCRVRWLNPVKYFDRFTTLSDFSADCFETCQ